MTRLTVVLPVFNEGANIERVLRLLVQYAPSATEILIIYDFDEDDTVPVVQRLEFPGLRLVKNTRGRGVLNAMLTGIQCASGRDILVTMADGSDDLSDLPAMISASDRGAVVVAASRYMKGGAQIGGPRLKRMLSRSAGLLLRVVGGLPIHDPTSNFKLYSAAFLRNTAIESTAGFELALELCVKAHKRRLPMAEVPTVWTDRTAGESRFALWLWLPHYLRWFAYGLLARVPSSSAT